MRLTIFADNQGRTRRSIQQFSPQRQAFSSLRELNLLGHLARASPEWLTSRHQCQNTIHRGPSATNSCGPERWRQLSTVEGDHQSQRQVKDIDGKVLSAGEESESAHHSRQQGLLVSHLNSVWIQLNALYLAQPHNSVSETSFFKHIDCDLPEPERVRQLLIWCSLRAAATPTPSTSKSSTSPPLPPLSGEAVLALKGMQDDVVRMLAEKRIDLSLYSSASGSKPPQKDLRENEQNLRNRRWEVTYTNHIQQCVFSFHIDLPI